MKEKFFQEVAHFSTLSIKSKTYFMFGFDFINVWPVVKFSLSYILLFV